MAFKMKGSAFYGKGNQSPVKHSGAAYAAEVKKDGIDTSKYDYAKAHNDNFAPGHEEHTGDQNEPQPGSKNYKEKESPNKNYKNPQDYKVFNMGNKPTPVKQKEQKEFVRKRLSDDEIQSMLDEGMDAKEIESRMSDDQHEEYYKDTEFSRFTGDENRDMTDAELDETAKTLGDPKSWEFDSPDESKKNPLKQGVDTHKMQQQYSKPGLSKTIRDSLRGYASKREDRRIKREAGARKAAKDTMKAATVEGWTKGDKVTKAAKTAAKSPNKQKYGKSPNKDLGHGGHAGLSDEEIAKRTHSGKMSKEDVSRRQAAFQKKYDTPEKMEKYVAQRQKANSPNKDLGHGGHPGMSKEEAAARTHGGKMSEEDLGRRRKARFKKSQMTYDEGKERDRELIKRRKERDAAGKPKAKFGETLEEKSPK